MRLDLFGTRKQQQPETLRVTFAVYPDGYECKIERAKNVGPGYWSYGRGAAAGPRKADAIRSAESEGARIETRTGNRQTRAINGACGATHNGFANSPTE